MNTTENTQPTATKTRSIAATIHNDAYDIATKLVLEAPKPLLLLAPEISAEGHLGTEIHIVFPGFRHLTTVDEPEAVVQSFLDDMKIDLEAMIHGGLAKSAVEYVKSVVAGQDFKAEEIDVHLDEDGTYTAKPHEGGA